jgi:membrane protease YdiL (CAAX protease family)
MPDSETVGRLRRFLRHPWMLLPVKVVLVVAPVVLVSVLAHGSLHASPALVEYLADPMAVLLAIALFVLYTRRVEGRAVTELDPAPAPIEIGVGFVGGLLLFTLVIGTLAALGAYHIVGYNHASIIFKPLVSGLLTGVSEELLVRGVLFRIAEDSLGSYWALVITAVFFGAAHLGNPHATLLAGTAITIEAGIMLAAAYMLTRRLWLPIGLHAGWNFTQGGLFGVAVSGNASHGLLQGTLTGPVWLSGGEFGPESSIVAIIFCGLLGIAVLMRARQLGHVRAPYWQRLPPAISA